jgi:hypothetical protein
MQTETVSPADLAAEKLNPSSAAPTATAAPAPAAPPAPPAPPAEPAGVPGAAQDIDSLGRPFDPAKFHHKTDSRGRWVNANSGRKPKSAQAATASGRSYVAPDAPAAGQHPTNGSVPEAGRAVPQSDRFDLAAEMYARAGYSVLDGIFAGNGEWLPDNDAEHIALRGALATYLRHKQTDDLPPGLALSLALATYGAKRVSKPNTLSRIRMFSYWVRAKIYAWKTGRSLDNLPEPAPAPASEQRPLPPQNLPAADSSTQVKP